MSTPLISIILPTYNSAKFLEKAVESALDQTFSDFELIIVDNASSDSTTELIRKFSDQRIKYIRYAENIGMVNNINKGLGLACGKLGVILCADDHWNSAFLERSVRTQESNPGLTFTNCITVRDGIETLYRNVHQGHENIAAWRLVRHLHGIPLSSLMFPLHSELVGFDPLLPFNCDLEFVLRSMLQLGGRLTMIDWPGVYVSLHGSNETLRYDIRLENIKLLKIVASHTYNPLLRLLIKLKMKRLQFG